MDLIAQVVDVWRQAGVELNPAASSDSLDALGRTLGVPLPPDVVAFFSTANGMADSAMAEWLTSFWSIEKILSQRLERSGQDAEGQYRDVAFADVMIDSWCLWFRTRPSGALSIFVEGSGEEHESLTVALERFMATQQGWNW